MPSYDTVSGVMEFLGSYRKAFENYDTDTILDHYVFPCTIVSDAEKITPSLLQTREELRAGVDYVLSLHRQIGYRSGQLLLLDITELPPRLTGMTIRSRMRDENGRPLYEFQGFIRLRALTPAVASWPSHITKFRDCSRAPADRPFRYLKGGRLRGDNCTPLSCRCSMIKRKPPTMARGTIVSRRCRSGNVRRKFQYDLWNETASVAPVDRRSAVSA
jgi:hypothetical protein